MRVEYMVETGTDPYRNLATEQELLQNVMYGTAVLYLWQNDNTIVIGRNQDVYNECRVADFIEEGGTIARRRSGGGAVYHDMGNLNFSIIYGFSEKEEHEYYNLIIDVLEILGIKAEYNGRNDIVVGGRKCSGNAVYQDGNVVCRHGTLLVHTDIKRMVSFLTPDKGKLDRHHVASIASRVINLEEIDENISMENIRRAFIQAAHGTELKNRPDKDKIDKLAEFYRSEAWIFGGKQ